MKSHPGFTEWLNKFEILSEVSESRVIWVLKGNADGSRVFQGIFSTGIGSDLFQVIVLWFSKDWNALRVFFNGIGPG